MNVENSLPRSAPEPQGVSSAGVNQFIDAIEQARLALHSFMLLRSGCVVAEGWWSPYRPQDPHVLFSLSKSFTSSAVGLAVEEGQLRIDDRVVDFFPADAPARVGKRLAAMQVGHLLTMTTGHSEDTRMALSMAADGNGVRAFLAQPLRHAPGAHFLYNNGATYMLSAIIQQVSGQTLLDYLRPCLFGPLGIADPTWDLSEQGICLGYMGLSLRTEEIARFGQLYLQKGWWNGRRVLPEAWVAAATARQAPNGRKPNSDWEQGYGYQFWRCRHNAYRGDGAFGQFCIVLPDQDAVVAMTGEVMDMQAVLNHVWERLLPALHPGPLPPDPRAAARLARRLAGLVGREGE